MIGPDGPPMPCQTMKDFFENKAIRLWIILAGFFIANAIIAEFIGVKLFSLEKTLGFPEAQWTIMGYSGLTFTLTAGVLLWPMVFVMTDIINEYYGPKGVKFLSYLAASLIALGFAYVYFAMQLQPADFWRTAHIHSDWPVEKQEEMRRMVGDFNSAFNVIFGQSMWIIVGSISAFLFSQVLDVSVFHWIKSRTGEKWIWLRATGSTMVSQFVDSFVVLFIAFYLGQHIPLSKVMAFSIMSYIYKGSIAILMTPVVYGIHGLIERYLGHDLALKMKTQANNPDA